MGRKDQKQKIYFNNTERFADLMNGVFFGGKQVNFTKEEKIGRDFVSIIKKMR